MFFISAEKNDVLMLKTQVEPRAAGKWIQM